MTALKVLPLDRRSAALLGAAIIVAATCVAYLPSLLWGGFVWDDDSLLTESELIKDPEGLLRFWASTDPPDYWPVSNSSLWIEWRLWGEHPLGYRLTNLVLHLASAMLLWQLLRRLEVPGAWLGALLFTVHPVNVEAVAWIAQRKTLLAQVFCLSSILSYLQADGWAARTGRAAMSSGLYWLSLAFFLLAGLSKGSVLIEPLVLLAIVWWIRGRIRAVDLLNTGLLFVMSVALVAVNIWFQHQSGEVIRSADWAERIAGAGAVPWFYLSKVVVPAPLMFVYPQWNICTNDVRDWLPLLATIGLTVVLWMLKRRRVCRAAFFAWITFCIALVPVMGLTDVYFMKYSLVADHYQYLGIGAAIALIVAGGSKIYTATSNSARRVLILAATAVVIVLMALTWRQCLMYIDAPTIWKTTIERNPAAWMAYNNLGSSLISTDPQPAVEKLERALELKSDYAEAHNNLAAALIKLGRPADAIEHCREAIRLKPQSVQAYQNLGAALLQSGSPQEAIEPLKQSLALKAANLDASNYLARAYFAIGRPDEAVQTLQLAVDADPDSPAAETNLGAALVNSGKHVEAIPHFERALKLNAELAATRFNLAQAYAALDRRGEAIDEAHKGLELAGKQGQIQLQQMIDVWLRQYQAEPTKQ